MASVFSKIGTILIVLLIAGLVGNTPAGAMNSGSMSVEVVDCQDCGVAGNMQSTGAVCASVCIVSVAVDKIAIVTTPLHNVKRSQFERLISRLRERDEHPEPHPPKHTS